MINASFHTYQYGSKKFFKRTAPIIMMISEIHQSIIKQQIDIRSLVESDISIIVSQFAKHNWPKPVSTFEAYFKEQHIGERLVWVAYSNNQFAGSVTLKWQSRYEPFRIKKIPEIMDINVLPPFQGQDIGLALLKTAEDAAFKRSDVGIGAGYGNAQKLYIKHGYVPDGNGITYNYQPVEPGTNTLVDDDLILWLTHKNLKK